MRVRFYSVCVLAGLITAVAALVGVRAAHEWLWPGLSVPQTFAVGLMASCVAALLVAALFDRAFQRSLACLEQQIRALASGPLPEPITSASPSDLEKLHRTLESTAEDLGVILSNLTDARRQADAVLESLIEGVIALDTDGNILLINPAAARLFGADRFTAVGKPLLDVVRQHVLDALVERVLATQKSASADLTIFHPTDRFLRALAIPCEGRDPRTPSVVLVIQDVTEHQAFDRLRKEFVANVSHELKTPLTSIRGLTETLLDGAIEDAQNNRRFLTVIDEEAARLSRLIDDLLTLSQVEAAEKQDLALKEVPLKPFLEAIRASFEAEVAKRRLRLSVDVDPSLRVKGDEDRLRQVFINLIDNAVKYNKPGGSVAVSAKAEGAWIKISVEDTGIGIPESDQPRIFERFYRVDKARSRELGGTGLGLSIVKHIVEAHKGKVAVTSRLGEGSTFLVSLPKAV